MKNMEKAVEMEESTCSSSSVEDQGTPLRPIFCLKKKVDLKIFDDIYDCFILDFDPVEPIPSISNLSVSSNDDLSVVAEKGQVACRDYPHSRHLCLKYPFDTTPHENFCHMCYCYVCDSVAPCKYWEDPKSAHCHASEHIDAWKLKRSLGKNQPPPCS
ncbi:uncharacterized protein LOC110630272 [Manihot esculenta]|uniref:Uncharacterized protein n=2 Tax=Manihot esculenta TaxID=3983 RepID=A0ACB7IAQ8_MANES|nr:uncharacterized protein LOC110630272 [Manihot esculenta]KAG8661840.1 hypothetical protein MANES_01G043800v8 [Manihot esculenta]